jgi:hypothetical protein
MKKVLATLALLLCLTSPAFAAYTTVPAGPPASASVPFWPFFTAVSFGAFVVYADAEGLAFPLCGKDWMTNPNATSLGGHKCYGSYPQGRNGL